MDPFSKLLSQLAAEHRRLQQECERLRSDAEAWRAQERREDILRKDHLEEDYEIAEEHKVRLHFDEDSPEDYPDVASDDSSSQSRASSGGSSKVASESGHRCTELARVPNGAESSSSLSKRIRLTACSCPAKGDSRVAVAADRSCHCARPESGSQKTTQVRAPGQSDSLDSLPSMGKGTTLGSNTVALKLLPRWVAGPNEDGRAELMKMIANGMSSLGSAPLEVSTGSESKGCVQVPVLRPCSKVRVVWDLISMAVLSYDVVVIPMLAFEMEDDYVEDDGVSAKHVLHFVTMVFWTCDIPASFLTGFYNGGIVEMRFTEIAKHYARGWLPFDLILVTLDWAVTILQNVAIQDVVGAGRVAKMLRFSRALRLFRLLRMLKLPEWAEKISECIRSQGFTTSMGVMRSLLIIAIANHFIACAWYLLGGQVRPLSWVQVLDDEGRDTPYRYITALHWSLTQFTPASMEVVPRSVPERVFTVVVILGAMVAFSCFVSSITQAMASLQRAHAQRDLQQNTMRRYIIENHVSLDLGHRITRFLQAHVNGNRRLQERDVEIFKLLPPSLSQELHVEVFMPVLRQHPLLLRTVDLDYTFVQELCHEAMCELSLARSEELLQPGEEASLAYFMQSGTWEYRRRRRRSRRQKGTRRMSSLIAEGSSINDLEKYETPLEIEGQKCFCEVALWLQCRVQGRLAASSTCEGVSLNAKAFGDIAERMPHMRLAFQEYAKRYRDLLDNQGESCAIELGLEPKAIVDIVQETMKEIGDVCQCWPNTSSQELQSIVRDRARRWTFGSDPDRSRRI